MADLEKRTIPNAFLSYSQITDFTIASHSPLSGSSTDVASQNDTVVPPPGIKESVLMRKIDLHVVPVLCVLYLLAFLDRVNISNAAIFGLREDLGLGGVEYNTALTIFFVPYIVFEVPSNILLKKLRPHLWLSGCMFMFGLVTTLQGLVQTYSGILATRFFLGVFEAGMFPGCFYLIAMWYKREEAQKRYSFFFNSTSLAGAFGGLLASGIGNLDGMRGYRGWRWVFILEGVLTCVVGILFYFCICDFPEEATFLSEEERQYVKARLRQDVGNSAREEKMTVKDVLNVFKDYKIFIGGFMYFGLVVPAYGYAYFAPSIVRDFGYDAIETQLRSVPPWVVAFVWAMILAVASDYSRHRFMYALGSMAVAAVGVIILLAVHDNIHVQYFALFLITSGCFGSMPIIVCWFNSNLGGHHRRGVGTAWQVGFGNIGGIIATYSFVQSDSPRYVRGYSILLAFIGVSAISCIAYFIAVTVENRSRDNGTYKYCADSQAWEALSEEEKAKAGDLSPEYRYYR
ncbi:major facilitator superfamily domain-containing protein [Kalaharituber pfeilii]|nr:major facilitator superfamily domain-containing protein [Kalaharituber pfeilii]